MRPTQRRNTSTGAEEGHADFSCGTQEGLGIGAVVM